MILAIPALGAVGCDAAHPAKPCCDTAVIIPGGSPVECHPQASIETAPVGSAQVLVTCRCNILPLPRACTCKTCETGSDAGDASQ